jgi:hypothetical protein
MKRSQSSHSSSSSDQAHGIHAAKRPRTERGLFSGLVVHIIQRKMGSTEGDLLSSLAESNGASVQSSIRHADVLVTHISTRKGLERHVKWGLVVCYALCIISTVLNLCVVRNRKPSLPQIGSPCPSLVRNVCRMGNMPQSVLLKNVLKNAVPSMAVKSPRPDHHHARPVHHPPRRRTSPTCLVSLYSAHHPWSVPIKRSWRNWTSYVTQGPWMVMREVL